MDPPGPDAVHDADGVRADPGQRLTGGGPMIAIGGGPHTSSVLNQGRASKLDTFVPLPALGRELPIRFLGEDHPESRSANPAVG